MFQRLMIHIVKTSSALLAFCLLPDMAGFADEAGISKVNLSTVYLTEKISDAHKIQLRAELGGTGTLSLDPNSCGVNDFGDQTICTRIAIRSVDVTVTQIRTADPTGKGRRLFEIKSQKTPLDQRLMLVVPVSPGGQYRLVVVDKNDRRQVVSLEGSGTLTKAAGKLCSSAKYSAIQENGVVELKATGMHPTPGWKTKLEQMPIRIFPPQFRLTCNGPSGIVAQVLTPFEVSTRFKAGDPVQIVVVHDARGRHEITVQQKN